MRLSVAAATAWLGSISILTDLAATAVPLAFETPLVATAVVFNLETRMISGGVLFGHGRSACIRCAVAGSQAHYLPFGGYRGYTGQRVNLEV